MAKTLEAERAALEEESRRLEERRKRLEEREREAAIQTVDKSGLLKLEPARLGPLVERIRKLGVDEVEKRLTA